MTETPQTHPSEPPGPRRAPGDRALAFWFGRTDVLPLCAFRVVFGLMLAWTYVDLLPDAWLLYSDSGIAPRSSVLGILYRSNRFSLLDAVGSGWMAAGFLIVALVLALMLAVGYRTRLAAVASFVCLLSVHERNLLVLDGSDLVFRVLAFWMMFAPLDRALSVDAAHSAARGTPLPRQAPAFYLRILQLQVAAIYAFNFWNKSLGARWHDGSALRYALHLEGFLTRDLARLVADREWFTVTGTYATLVFEATFLPLLFFPIFQPYVRAVALAAGAAFHGGVALLMKVGWFSYLMPTTYLLFFEPEWVERGARLADRLTGGRLRRLGLALGRLSALLPPAGTRTRPLPGLLATSLGRAAAAALFTLSMWDAMPGQAAHYIPTPALAVVEFAGLAQSWDMFAPEPLDTEGHLAIVGTLENGETVDLIRAGFGQGGFRPTRPYYEGWYYSRWMKVAERMSSRDWTDYRLEYARSICRAYNWTLPEGAPRLHTFKIFWVNRRIVFPEEPQPEWSELLLWEHECYSDAGG